MKGSTRARSVALVAAGIVAGGVLAGTLSATAATGTSGNGSTGSPTTTAPPAYGATDPGARRGPMGPGGPRPVRSDEKQVTGANATTLTAAALEAVPGGTVVRVETDSGDAAYEVHMTKSDGSLVTVKFDKNLVQTGVEDGMGR